MNAVRPSAITLENVIVTYRRLPAVHHVSGTFAPGTLTAIAGPNGAGKSTLLKTTAGLLKPSEGRVLRGALKPSDIAYLPQLPEIDRTFPISVAETVMLGAWKRAGAFGEMGAAEEQRVQEALACVNLVGYARAPIAALSAGQWQRVLFARAIVQEASVVLLDEPFAGLDEDTQSHLISLVHEWHENGRTVIAVLHETDFIRRHFPQTLLIARELIAWGPTVDVLTPDNLARARTTIAKWARSEDMPEHQHHHG
ncbi:MAG: ATP-binding cassette domain-containing protein [Alphaproteobacteria bacterium]|nr:ATP-binding cassette domain-containing protein [Alphaproteobacteria bacterium]